MCSKPTHSLPCMQPSALIHDLQHWAQEAAETLLQVSSTLAQQGHQGSMEACAVNLDLFLCLQEAAENRLLDTCKRVSDASLPSRVVWRVQ